MKQAAGPASQQAGSMLKEAGTSGRAQPLSCSSDFTKYALFPLPACVHEFMVLKCGYLVQTSCNYAYITIQILVSTVSHYEKTISTSLQSKTLPICFIGQLLNAKRRASSLFDLYTRDACFESRPGHNHIALISLSIRMLSGS